MKSTRRQIITDQVVQGELLFRTIVYWFSCLTMVLLMIVGWSLWSGPPRPFLQVIRETMSVSAPVIFGAVVLLPLVLLDVLRVSSRFVGPIRQVRYVLKQLANGEEARRVYLRRKDFWQDLAHYTNIIAEDMESHRDPDMERPYGEESEVEPKARKPVSPR